MKQYKTISEIFAELDDLKIPEGSGFNSWKLELLRAIYHQIRTVYINTASEVFNAILYCTPDKSIPRSKIKKIYKSYNLEYLKTLEEYRMAPYMHTKDYVDEVCKNDK